MPDGSHAAISRRRALRVGGGGALAVIIGGAAGVIDRRRSPATAPAPTTTTIDSATIQPADGVIEVPGLGAVDEAVVRLGERVIVATGEADVDRLLAFMPLDDGEPIEQAARVVRAEFAARDTVSVDGWVLARSEARAAAILALLCRGSAC